ncbi:MAG: fibronectin type III domain-containing protein [Acidobacteriota bacterium]
MLTTKTEYAYPGEAKYEVNVRVHSVQGPIYMYPDLLQANVSSGTNAKVYKSGYTSTAFDEVNGAQPSGSWSFGDWYQVSSSKGSFLRTDGPHRYPTTRTTGGAYNDQTTPLWTDANEAVEYDIDETGDRAAGRSTFSDTCDTQNLSCDSDRVVGDAFGLDPLLMFLQGAFLMLDSGSATGTVGEEIVTDRARGPLGIIAIKQTQGGSGPGSPVFCSPTVSVIYANDGGTADLSPTLTGCSNLAGWDLYSSAGAGAYRRLGTLPLNVKFRDAGLLLNEQKTYYAVAVGNDGSRGSLSQGYVFTHSDTTAPAAPTAVSGSATAGQLTVSWTSPPDADVEKFKIYASVTSGGTATLIDGGTDSHCRTSRSVSAAPGTYYITVKAVDFAGNHSAASTQVQVTVP